jgi:hypothetical protein
MPIDIMTSMVKLNLPSYNFQIGRIDDRVAIFDVLRKRYIILTPEEWVRQHFLNYLVVHLQYPKSLIKVEGGLTFNTLRKRSDIVVYNRQGEPWMVVECKAPDLKLSQKIIEQASTYNHTLKARYIVITNGMSHICCEVDWAMNKTVVLAEMPEFQIPEN